MHASNKWGYGVPPRPTPTTPLALSVSNVNENTDRITTKTRLIVSDSNISDWPVGVKPAHILVMTS